MQSLILLMLQPAHHHATWFPAAVPHLGLIHDCTIMLDMLALELQAAFLAELQRSQDWLHALGGPAHHACVLS